MGYEAVIGMEPLCNLASAHWTRLQKILKNFIIATVRKIMRGKSFTLLILFCGMLLALGMPLAAQGNQIILQLALPQFLQDVISDDLLTEFEAQNPGVQVRLVTAGNFLNSPAAGIETYLEGLAEYAASADVLYVSTDTLSIEGTRAGYLLDLSPLSSTDHSLNSEDFLPQAWQSVQWDRGVWALPVAVDVYLLIYNPAAFDRAGLAYPDPLWTLADFASAARALTTTDVNGETQAGFFDFGSSEYLFRSLLGAALVDPSAFPIQPDFSNPAIEELLTTWAELQEEGAVSGLGGGASIIAIGGNAESGPAMSIQQSFALANFSGPGGSNQLPAGTLLPGGTAGLQFQGFSISAGTEYPAEAYALVKFLSSSPGLSDRLFGAVPARRSLANVETPPTQGGGRGPRFAAINIALSPENQALVDEALSRALAYPELAFVDYMSRAFTLMQQQGLDARSALQEVEAEALNNLNIAAAARNEAPVVVATPVPDVVLRPGEIMLKFGMTSFITPLPNQADWEQLMAQFIANDPQVGQIVFNTAFNTSLSEMAEDFDCFYLPTNGLRGGDASSLISLDPFMDADPFFDKSDVIGSTLAQLQINNQTWAYPINIQPEVLRYNRELFAHAGITPPDQGWTSDAFADALRRLQDWTDKPPFIPRGFGDDYLLKLIAAYGGLPVDYRTNPPTVNFTDPTTVDAIRQVLDLAKEGLIDYSALAQPVGGGARIAMIGAAVGLEDTDAIYTHSLNQFNIFAGPGGQRGADSYQLAPYPTGSQYTPISYDIGTAYISANAQNPEACYRWLSEIARHPDLFSAMPARRSLINDPSLTVTQDASLIALYNQIDAQLSQSNIINLPASFGGGASANAFLRTWLDRAFDRYVLEDAELEAELAQAEVFTREYQACAEALPPIDTATTMEERIQYFQQYNLCATRVDASID